MTPATGVISRRMQITMMEPHVGTTAKATIRTEHAGRYSLTGMLRPRDHRQLSGASGETSGDVLSEPAPNHLILDGFTQDHECDQSSRI
jgi:hypothetical protein